MKGSQNLHQLQQNKREKEEVDWIHQPICCVCNRKCEGYHGRWGNTGTCDSACEAKQVALPKYPGHSAEAFEALHNL